MARLASPDHDRSIGISSQWICESSCPDVARHIRANQEQTLLDILMLALAAGFFALAIGYTYACERL